MIEEKIDVARGTGEADVRQRIAERIDQRRTIKRIGEAVLGILVVMNQFEEETDHLRRTHAVLVALQCHCLRNGLLDHVHLRVGEVVHPNDTGRCRGR